MRAALTEGVRKNYQKKNVNTQSIVTMATHDNVDMKRSEDNRSEDNRSEDNRSKATETLQGGGKTVVTFGTFDVFHVGHLSILDRASRLGTRLVVGVSTDVLNQRKKGRKPLFSQQDRVAIITGLRCVSEAFYESALEDKRKYLLQYSADVLVMGDDWAGRFDEFKDICDVVYLPRKPGVSTTDLMILAAQRTADGR